MSPLQHSNGSRRNPFNLGVFTRLVDRVSPTQIYAHGLDLLERAEQLGFDTAWVAQHHAHFEGGLPSPLVFLSAAAQRTSRITLVTGIITLPLEQPLRLAEDAAVLHVLSGGRFELGFGSGANEIVFSLFGRELKQRQADYDRNYVAVRNALAGNPLVPDGPTLFPPAPHLLSSMWEAAMSMSSSARAGEHGTRLLLARTGARTADTERAHLGQVQRPFVDNYLAHYTGTERPPRIGLSRSVYVAESRAQALADAEAGIRRHAEVLAQRTGLRPDLSTEELLRRQDVHIGTPEEVIESLRADPLLEIATDLILQVHPVDPPHAKSLRSLELIATQVAPALGWQPGAQLDRALVGGVAPTENRA
ncbi:MAG: LLM class flavin-dependent oxidoreductase [Chloroflexi bacterium]|nr:LLM class flavin-dependent oxidoreductase [Chloroflexota bacterium]